MATKTKILGGAGLAVAVLVALAVWWFGSSPDPEVSIGAAVEAADADAGQDDRESVAEASDDAEDASQAQPPTFTAEEVDGTWTVEPGIAADVNAGSFVGYRINEVLNNVGEATATGRTPGVEGAITIADGAVTEASFTADMTQLRSDKSMRDRALATRGIEHSRFPTATFTLTEPVAIDADALAAGDAQTVVAAGELDLHGVVVPYSIDLTLQATGSTVVVVGSVDVALADHEITKPTVGPVASIEDVGTLEVQLFFAKG